MRNVSPHGTVLGMRQILLSLCLVFFAISALGIVFDSPPQRRLHFESRPVPPLRASAAILFGGDMMFDRSVRTVSRAQGDDFLFSCIDQVLQRADLVVANLEGPITSNPSVSEGSVIDTPENYTFTFPTTTAALLARHGIRLVSIGNNHILNFEESGLAETKQLLSKAGVSYIGDPLAPASDDVYRRTISGVPFSFVSWSDWTGDTEDNVVAAIAREASAGRLVIVYAHWGDEYVPPPPRVRELAHRFVDSGAALVVGSHPHIVQEHEMYRGRPIYYSLGNFIFDQYWDASVRTGLLLRATFDRFGPVRLEEIPINLEQDRRACPA